MQTQIYIFWLWIEIINLVSIFFCFLQLSKVTGNAVKEKLKGSGSGCEYLNLFSETEFNCIKGEASTSIYADWVNGKLF